MRKLLLTAALLSRVAAAWSGPAPTGLWLTQGHDGVIGIAPCGEALCGQIVGVFLDRPTDPMPRDYRGMSQCHLPLFTDAYPVGPNLWKGHIIDPRNGQMHQMELHMTPAGDLALRGFVGIPLLGRTEVWTPYQGRVPADCRILPRSRTEMMRRAPVPP